MTTIFVCHARENAGCAEQLRKGLESQGYITWREPQSLDLNSILYPRTIHNVILGSAAVVLVWSSEAAQSSEVGQRISFAQRLKKLIVPLLLDGTALPGTLASTSAIRCQAPCADALGQLVPLLPAVNSTEPLIALSEQAAHEFIHERKAAIDQAALLLQRGEQREQVLAVLEYLAHNDILIGVREKAQEVLDADAIAQKATSLPPFVRPGDAHHIFGVRCKNGHVSYFDRRDVCRAYIQVPREIVQDDGKELDELHLKCNICGIEVIKRVDCGEYK